MAHYAISTLIVVCLGAPAAWPSPEEPARVFPGARGFGIRTPAGRGGRVIKVSNLNPEGPGSLREAVSARGPRVVVFEVGGVIDLNLKGIAVVEPFLTIAGQTAPSPGITLIRGSLLIKTHDVLVRHLRIRPGDGGGARHPDAEPEAGVWGPEAYNVVWDHCSFSWGVEDNLAVGGHRPDAPRGAPRNITFSNCIVAESLREGGPGKGGNSMGSMVGENCSNVAMIGSLLAHNLQHNPYFKANTTGAIVNNVIYNPGRYAIQLDLPTGEWRGRPTPSNPKVSVVGNVLIHGVDTEDELALVSRKGDAYLLDNVAYDRSGTPAAITAGRINVLSERPAWPRGLNPLPSGKVLESVLRGAGARPKDRDEADRRIVRDVRERKGRVIDSQEDVGGYPKPAPTRRRLIVPPDDLDEWLAKLAAEVE